MTLGLDVKRWHVRHTFASLKLLSTEISHCPWQHRCQTSLINYKLPKMATILVGHKTRQLIEGQHKHRRPKVRDMHQPVATDILEKRQYENKLWQSVKLDPRTAPGFPCNKALFKPLSSVLYDYGLSNYTFDENFAELRLLRFIDSHLSGRFLSGLKDDEKRLFNNYIAEVNELIKALYDKQIADTKAMVETGKSYQSKHDDDVKRVQNFYAQKQTEAKLIAAEKSKPARVYSEEQKAQGIHWQDFAAEDLKRSKESLKDKKDDIKKKQIRVLEKDIDELNSQIQPLQEKITKLESQLSGDNLSESDFKDIKMGIEFNQNKVQKIADKILPLSVENSEHNLEVEKINHQLAMLDCLIKREELLRDVKVNEPRRRERLIFRVEKFMRKHADLETSRLNLNDDWKKLTGDSQELIPVLGLKTDSQMYFI